MSMVRVRGIRKTVCVGRAIFARQPELFLEQISDNQPARAEQADDLCHDQAADALSHDENILGRRQFGKFGGVENAGKNFDKRAFDQGQLLRQHLDGERAAANIFGECPPYIAQGYRIARLEPDNLFPDLVNNPGHFVTEAGRVGDKFGLAGAAENLDIASADTDPFYFDPHFVFRRFGDQRPFDADLSRGIHYRAHLSTRAFPIGQFHRRNGHSSHHKGHPSFS